MVPAATRWGAGRVVGAPACREIGEKWTLASKFRGLQGPEEAKYPRRHCGNSRDLGKRSARPLWSAQRLGISAQVSKNAKRMRVTPSFIPLQRDPRRRQRALRYVLGERAAGGRRTRVGSCRAGAARGTRVGGCRAEDVRRRLSCERGGHAVGRLAPPGGSPQEQAPAGRAGARGAGAGLAPRSRRSRAGRASCSACVRCEI